MINVKVQTPNNTTDISNISQNHLSIQLSLDGFTYCIFNKELVDVTFLKSFEFSNRAQNEAELLKNVQEIFQSEPFLNEKFETVNVSHFNQDAVLVPDSIYDEDCHFDYLKFTNKTSDNQLIKVDSLGDFQAKNVFVPFSTVSDFISEKFEKVETFHSSTIFLNALFKNFKSTPGTNFFINVANKNFEVAFLINGRLELYNSYTFETDEDFLFYVLNIFEQLDLKKDVQEIILLGNIDENSELYGLLFKFIKNISFLNAENFSLSDEFYLTNIQIKKHQFFELLNQF